MTLCRGMLLAVPIALMACTGQGLKAQPPQDGAGALRVDVGNSEGASAAPEQVAGAAALTAIFPPVPHRPGAPSCNNSDWRVRVNAPDEPDLT